MGDDILHIVKYYNRNEVEFALLESLDSAPDLPLKPHKAITNDIWTAIKVVRDNTVLQSRDEDDAYLLVGTALEVGKHFIYFEYESVKLIEVTDDALDYSNIVKLPECCSSGVAIDVGQGPILTREGLIAGISGVEKAKIDAEKNAEYLKQVEKEKKKLEKASWEKGKYLFINENKLEFDGGVLSIDTWWKNIISLDNVNNGYYAKLNSDIGTVFSYLRTIKYKGNITIKMNDGTTYTARRFPKESHINGIKIPYSRIIALLEALIYDDISVSDLSIYSKLNLIRAEVASGKSMGLTLRPFDNGCRSAKIDIPISIKFDTPNSVKITMLGTTKDFEWSEVRELLVNGTHREEYLTISRFRKWCSMMEVSKDEGFRLLKSYMMLGQL